MADDPTNIPPMPENDADIAIPPIDNIHAPEPTSDLPSHGQQPQSYYGAEPLDTEMPEAAVLSPTSHIFINQNS